MAKVLVVGHTSFLRGAGAPFKRVRALLLALEELGHKTLHLDISPTQESVANAQRLTGAQVVAFEGSQLLSRGGGFNPLYWRHCTKVIRAVAREFEPDLVVVSSPPTAAIPPVAELKRLMPRSHLHLDFRDPYNSAVETLSIPRVARVPFSLLLRHHDQAVKRSLRRFDSVSHAFSPIHNPAALHFAASAQTYIWENGVDLAEIAAVAGVKRFPNRVVFVGSLADYYYPEWLLPSLRHLKHVEYIVVGAGPGSKRIVNHPDFASVASRVHLVGRLPSAEALKLLASATVAVYPPHPTVDFALAVKVLEYAACGVQVMSFTSPSSPVTRLIREWGIGETYSWNDDGEIARGLETLLERGSYDPNVQCPTLHSYDRIARTRRFAKWLTAAVVPTPSRGREESTLREVSMTGS